MQVDPSPMNIGDGGPVSRESGAVSRLSANMVGNPPQTLPPELRGDVPHSQQAKLKTVPDCKPPLQLPRPEQDTCAEAPQSNHCSDPLTQSQRSRNGPDPTAASTASTGPPVMISSLHERPECHKTKADSGAGVFPAWTESKKAPEGIPVNSGHAGMKMSASAKKTSPAVPSVISLQPGFQCSTLFLSSANFASPLCKITLPPVTGQIAALRKTTTEQFQKAIPDVTQQTLQNTQSIGTTLLPHSYPPFHFQVGGRGGATSDKKSVSAKSMGNTSGSKNSKLGAEQKTPLMAPSAPPNITVPIQLHPQPQAPNPTPPPRFTVSPSAAICCSPALASVTTPSKLLSLMDKGPHFRNVDKTPSTYLKLKSPPAVEGHIGSTVEERDVPLDLSAKSKRLKSSGCSGQNAQNNPLPGSATEPCSADGNQKNVTIPLKRSQGATFGSAPNSILPSTQRNGSNPKAPSSKPFNHQTLEPASWSKHSPQGAMNTIPGTYVGVASPILASTLRNKDGMGAFVEDLQSFAKQETISIVDQGDQLTSHGKESSLAATKKAQQSKTVKHSNTTGPVGAQVFPPKGPHPSGHMPPANSYLHRKAAGGKALISYPPAGGKTVWDTSGVVPQGAPLQRKGAHGGPKNKTVATGCEGVLFHHPKVEDEKWGKNNKSPLSNLESIVKQKALETTALTGGAGGADGYCGLLSVNSRRTELKAMMTTTTTMSSPTAFQSSQLSQPTASVISTFQPIDRRDPRPMSFPTPDSELQPINRQPDKPLTVGTRESCRENHGESEDQPVGKDCNIPSLNSQMSQLADSLSVGNRTEMYDNSAGQTVEAKKREEPLLAPKKPLLQGHVEGIVSLNPKGQSVMESKTDRGANDAKETPAFSEQAMRGKQRKVFLNKARKERPETAERPKKSPLKRPIEKTSPNTKERMLVKKRKTPLTTTPEQSHEDSTPSPGLPVGPTPSPSPITKAVTSTSTPTPQPKDEAKPRKGKSPEPTSLPDTPGPTSGKAGGEGSHTCTPRRPLEKKQTSLCTTTTRTSSPRPPSKQTPAFASPVQDTPSPRPRRGRRRADDLLHNDWGFSIPSPPSPPLPREPPSSTIPPPSPVPTPPPVPPKTSVPAVPVRRPRGRPRLNPLPDNPEQAKSQPAPSSALTPPPATGNGVGAGAESPAMKKRRRCRNRKYQNGEYITDKHKGLDREKQERYTPARQSTRTDARLGLNPRLSTALTRRSPSPELSPGRALFTRSGSTRRQDNQSPPETPDKPAGKRKCKSKHLIADLDEQRKLKTKRGSLVKDEESPPAKKSGGPLASPRRATSPVSGKRGNLVKGTGAPDSPPGRPIPPEVRRLIVNKNAGETLLQRAARLGYQDVVLYCLEKDSQEVNRRDNAGYTALHEACARGWTHIVQLLLEHGADVNCSAQDGTRPIHDAVAADNLPAAWILLNHGADPTLATYSGQTVLKLAQNATMRGFLKDYFTDLEGRGDQDPGLSWEFYSSAVFETEEDPCWDFLLSGPDEEDSIVEEKKELSLDRDSDADCLLFEFSSEPLLPCYHVQVALTQGFCNWFLLSDVLKRLKMSARIFRARYPHLEVASISKAELKKQVSISQTNSTASELHTDDEDEEREEEEEQKEEEAEEDCDEMSTLVELVRCVPELQGLLGSSIQLLRVDTEEEDEEAWGAKSEKDTDKEQKEREDEVKEKEVKSRAEEDRERRKRRSDSTRLCSR